MIPILDPVAKYWLKFKPDYSKFWMSKLYKTCHNTGVMNWIDMHLDCRHQQIYEKVQKQISGIKVTH